MSMTMTCDGCGKDLQPDGAGRAIHGERTNGLSGGGLPPADFDWCTNCAQTAFAGLAEHHAADRTATDRPARIRGLPEVDLSRLRQ